MSIVHNYASDSDVSQIRDFNSGGYANGLMRENGDYGGLLVGASGKVLGGLLGAVDNSYFAYLVMEDTDGNRYIISDDARSDDRRFRIDPAVQNHIPRGCRIWLNLVLVPGLDIGPIYWYLGTS